MPAQATASVSAKRAQRERMKALRARLKFSPNDVRSLHQNLINHLIDKDISALFCYLSTAEEVPSWALVEHYLQREGVNVTCPRIIDKQTMVAVTLNNTDQLEKGPLGIFTSSETTPYSNNIDVALVPGLAFTTSGNRKTASYLRGKFRLFGH